MTKLKWGEIPIGSFVIGSDGRAQLVLSKTGKSVSMLDMYHNRVVRRKSSTIANVTFKTN